MLDAWGAEEEGRGGPLSPLGQYAPAALRCVQVGAALPPRRRRERGNVKPQPASGAEAQAGGGQAAGGQAGGGAAAAGVIGQDAKTE